MIEQREQQEEDRTWSSSRASPSDLGYVAGIDGLRAVAITAVLLFHLNSSILPGGLVGVDIFFVISGFVVTSSLVGKRFRHLGELMLFFYARRIVRIMPALIVMLLTTAISYDLFVPDAWLSNTTRDVANAAFFGLSNVTLATQNDTYFSPLSVFNPFVHTWSLGVEEQFYLVFPFLLFWHQRRSNVTRSDGSTIAVLALLSLSSLAFCAYLTKWHWQYGFYSIPSRFWELGTGMILSLSIGVWRPHLATTPVRMAQVLMLCSVSLVALSFAIAATAQFPFPFALLPVVGAAGIIALVCSRREGTLYNLLSSPPAVKLGRLSYSLYLWHWPVFVLFRWTIGLNTWGTAATAAAVAFSLATASYTLIERTTQRLPAIVRLPRGWVVAGGLIAIWVSAVGGIAIFRVKPMVSLSWTAREPGLWYADWRKPITIQQTGCVLSQVTGWLPEGELTIWSPHDCGPPRTNGHLFVVGDSHSLVYDPILRQFAADTATEVRVYFKVGCPFLALDVPMNLPQCGRYFEAAVSDMLALMRAGDVLFLPSLRLPRFSDQWGDVNEREATSHGASTDRKAATKEAVAVVESLQRQGVHVVFEAPTPIFRSPAFRCSDWFNAENPVCKAGLSVPEAELQELRSPVLGSMNEVVAAVPHVSIWDPFPILCPGSHCVAVTRGGPLFFDGDHLSGYGADVISPGSVVL